MFWFLYRFRDQGLLILRIGLGIMFIIHGWPKVRGGPDKWAELGGAMANFGVTFAPAFWGLMSAVAEFGGGLLILIGLLTPIACLLLVINLTVAATKHMATATSPWEGFGQASHAIEDCIVFLALIFIGPGRFSLDWQLCHHSANEPRPGA